MVSLVRLAGRSFALLGRERRAVGLLLAVNAALALAQAAEPVLFGAIVNRVTGGDSPWRDVVALALGWALLGVVTIGCSVAVALNADRLAQRRRLAVLQRFFTQALRLPHGFHATVHSARLMKVMTDGGAALVAVWLPFFRDHCTALMVIAVALPLSLTLNWQLGAVLIATVALFGGITLAVLRRTFALQAAVEGQHTALVERTADVFGNLPVIQSFTRVGDETAAVGRLIEALLRAQIPVLSWWAVAAVATRASATVSLMAMLGLGLWLRARGLISVGGIVAFMSLATLLTGRLQQVVGFIHQLSLEGPKIRDLFAVLDRRSPLAEPRGATDPGRLGGHVVFEGASFAYETGGREAVSDLSFSARPGETVALVGATGSGKTTTLSLLYRVFDPCRGRVTVDGIDLRDMPLDSLRRNVGVVFQEPMLLCRSFEDNLRIGKPEATDAEIDHALAQAQAGGFVAAQPQGRATVVGQGGRALSGGERQRLSIARALIKDAPILIFDEATSALDPATERDVQAALRSAAAARTVFVIAHRLSTIRTADRILVFDRGRIVESGTFDELVARQATFARLIDGDGVPA